jgi:hypothetical protein
MAEVTGYPGIGNFHTFGYHNVYLPGYMGDAETQKRLIVGFTLNDEDFALNNYVTVLGADKPEAYYLRYYSPDFVRVPEAAGKDLRWADGADRPKAGENPRFINQRFELLRFGDQTYLGDMAEDFSDIGPLIPTVQQTFASQFMVRRSIATQTELTTSANYPSAGTTHYYAKYGVLANDSTIVGSGKQYPTGYFGTAGTNTIFDGTINDPLLGKTLKHAVLTILKRSNGRVKPQDLVVMMNPTTASRLANTQEVRAYLAQQANSVDVLKGKGDTPAWPTFGLPNPLYGLKVLVDATTKVAAKQDHVNEDTQSFVVADGLIAVMARPGGVAGMPGSSPLSSLVLWQHKKQAMKPETFPDPENRRLKIAFSDMYVVKLVAPEITFTIKDASDPATS